MKIGVDYIGVSAGAVIVNEHGKYFLAKRAAGARDDVGKWEFPGGTIKLFESREQAAKRNVLEKHGLQVVITDALGVYDVIDKVNNDHWISTTFICKPARNARPTIVDSKKCSDIGWFSFAELQKLDLSRITKLNVESLIAGNCV